MLPAEIGVLPVETGVFTVENGAISSKIGVPRQIGVATAKRTWSAPQGNRVPGEMGAAVP